MTDEEQPIETWDPYNEAIQLLIDAPKRIKQLEVELAAARESHAAQQRNTARFFRDREDLRGIIKGWQWAVCESEVLRDPTLKGRAREILNEIANGNDKNQTNLGQFKISEDMISIPIAKPGQRIEPLPGKPEWKQTTESK